FVQELSSPNDSPLPPVLDCAKCTPPTTIAAQSPDTQHLSHCLLCLPKTDPISVMSPSSSLLSPPRTPGTRPLPSYFGGRRLPHPKPPLTDTHISDEDGARMLLRLLGRAGSREIEKVKKRPRRELHLF